MRILQFVQKPQLRGAEIFACQLSDELNDQGHELIIVTLFAGTAELPFKGRIVNLNLSGKNRLFDIGGWRQIAALIEKEKPDLIQANAGDTLKYCIFSKLLFRWQTPVIFRNASMVSLYIKNSYVWFLNRVLYLFTSHIISVSEFTRKDLERLFPGVRKKISVAPIAVKQRSLEGYTSHQPNKFVVLHIGGFTFEKNHEGIIRIFKKVRQTIPHAELWLVGEGPLRTAIHESVKSQQLEHCVIFWGHQADPYSMLMAANVFILPSIIEGLPAVILESFYAKLPVVAYDVGAVSELVKHQERGLLTRPGNELEFANMIQRISQNDNQYFTNNAYKFVVEHYLLEKICSRFVEIYKKVLKSAN
jgi:glycosyltransferase involved in cell wall biosynthesis